MSEADQKMICVTLDGEKRLLAIGEKLSALATTELPCGGHGKCGKCKAIEKGEVSPISDKERQALSDSEIAAGVRLLCCTFAEGDCEIVHLDSTSGDLVLMEGKALDQPLDPLFSRYGVALDIGTTTMAARLYAANGTVLADHGMLNPQSVYGADVISRIEAAMGGDAHPLALAVRGAIDEILTVLAQSAGIPAREIDALVVTGNTAMLYLLTETDVEPLSHAPFHVERLFGEVLRADALGLTALQGDASVYLPACIAAFVGADTVCALLASDICETGKTVLLADIGTNGEMALVHQGTLTVCSTAAGPAFEGVGISMGMRGAIGAIDRVRVENGALVAHVIGEGAPIGICGSGLVDTIACLLETEAVDETGYMEDDEAQIAAPVVLTQQDVRMVQLAKSAICAGLQTLLKTAGVDVSEVESLVLAGGFGSYLDAKNAGRIGLIPAELAQKTAVIGNAALDGASMILLDKSASARADRIAKSAKVKELSADPVFSEFYMMGMMFSD